MLFYSTRNSATQASLEEALFKSLPPDNGLYMPEHIPSISEDFLDQIEHRTFNEIAVEVAYTLLQEDISRTDMQAIVARAFSFEAPVVQVGDIHILELFHGPSMAFKDFGARFMAALMSHFLVRSQREIRILVATSGDTGGAVAQGFFDVPGISVTILYPSGKVSAIQEKQLTTLGKNVTALEIDGTFDDCQRLVKEAFLDQTLNERFTLASANSINIARLIPQSFYYFSAYAQLKALQKPVIFAVPSGNFGNLSAGLLAWRMGLPVARFLAATNRNNVVPRYLKNGIYEPKPSIETISNAMDVGNPSNFVRMQRFFNDQWKEVCQMVEGYDYDDTQTRQTMREVYDRTGYVLCPHTAVAYRAMQAYSAEHAVPYTGVVLATAHPAKFQALVEDTLQATIPVPTRLADLLSLEKHSILLGTDFAGFQSYLIDSGSY